MNKKDHGSGDGAMQGARRAMPRNVEGGRQARPPAMGSAAALSVGLALAGLAGAGELASPNATASGRQGVAIGVGAEATEDSAVGLGTGAKANGWHGIAIGTGAATAVGTAAGARTVREVAIGDGASTASNDATALGTNAKVQGGNAYGAMALGNGATVSAGAFEASVLGYGATAGAIRSLALGTRAAASGTGSMAAGVGAQTSAFQGLAIGFGAKSSGNRAQAFGHGASAKGDDNLAIGTSAESRDGYGEVAIGNAAIASGTHATAIGTGAQAVVESVALGAGAVAARGASTGYAAFGLAAAQDSVGEVAVGHAGGTRQITHLAAGSAATDAVNVSQLGAVAGQVNAVVGQTVFDPSTGVPVAPVFTVQGRTFGNLAATLAAVDDGLTAAYVANQALAGAATVGQARGLAAALGGGARLRTDGSFQGPGYAIDDIAQDGTATHSIYTSVGDALGGLNGSIQNLNRAVQGLGKGGGTYLNTHSTGAAAQAAGTDGVALGAGARATGERGIAIGAGSSAADRGSIAIGADSSAAGEGATAVGQGARVADGGAAFGGGAEATGARKGTALGNGASARADEGVALGAGSVADRAGLAGGREAISGVAVASARGAVSMGSEGGERQLVNVAGGTRATDAVNLRQLQAVQAASVQYDRNADGTLDHGRLTLGDGQAPDGTVVSNVAPGVAGTDAVNVNQLNGVQAATAARIDAVGARVEQVARTAYAGIASAMAVQVPGLSVPGKTVMRVGTAVFKGEGAAGLSFRRTSASGAWSVTGGMGLSRVGAAATVGAEYVFD